ncbi:cupin-like domain-containing protein [Alteraurantiacibacter buctensis]|uniref:Cupin-like domain-containing protein n=1 Tax=Alteraurantiacibacter buctensis TaxID=1503981 RepID=A0A844YUY0_9SPHN|nr:cupin-like domain-containing protein [Alteraurantiacibacter buctensis]MXO70688.1 cupin-like domain-containing protein [Alteraurantiacibacter buctensis]
MAAGLPEWGTPVRRLAGLSPAAIPWDELFATGQPVVLEGLAADWPLVRAGLDGGPRGAADYLRRFATGAPVTVFTAPPEVRGRFHYKADLAGLNFTSVRGPLADVLDRILATQDQDESEAIYVGSTDLAQFLPGFAQDNRLPLDHPDFAVKPVVASLWLGTRTTAAAHYDMSANVACNLVGQRRFTLFPPDQVANLYPGPLEPTPGGQVVTMVDFAAPDLARYPRFADAMKAALVADLSPGDVLYYPALWWHQVDATGPLNAMVNYWWNPVPSHIDTPHNTLLHALLSLRDRPEGEKKAWRALFDYYVFGDGAQAAAHLPEHARGPLGPMDDMTARRLRAQLLNRLNR